MRKSFGKIVSFFSGVGKVSGVEPVFTQETLLDEEGKEVGLVIGFDEEFLDVLFFDENIDWRKKIRGSGEIFNIKISDTILGRVIDGLGRPLDGLGPIFGKKFTIFQKAPQIIEREPITKPLITGIKIIDTTLPLGRGQRELIVGDRKLGKTTLAVDTVLNQRYAQPPVICVYVLCGQKRQKLESLIETFEKKNAFLYTTVVSATSDDSLASQYLAPFVGMRIGEYFRDKGKDVLVVFDDLTQHARVYRSISLLLERPPGRESYPGDIFSLHARLLERAGRLAKERGGGSITALPIIETQEGDISSFIPTNLISITDGQIYLERGLFHKGFLPAVNIGLSVSRVGSQVQPLVLREVVKGLRMILAQHRELQRLAQLETKVSEKAKREVKRGDLILELLKQEKHTFYSFAMQTALFFAVENGFFDDIERDKWQGFEKMLLELIRIEHFKILREIEEKQKLTPGLQSKIKEIVIKAKREFYENLS